MFDQAFGEGLELPAWILAGSRDMTSQRRVVLLRPRDQTALSDRAKRRQQNLLFDLEVGLELAREPIGEQTDECVVRSTLRNVSGDHSSEDQRLVVFGREAAEPGVALHDATDVAPLDPERPRPSAGLLTGNICTGMHIHRDAN
jgi:hypothetical protein